MTSTKTPCYVCDTSSDIYEICATCATAEEPCVNGASIYGTEGVRRARIIYRVNERALRDPTIQKLLNDRPIK